MKEILLVDGVKYLRYDYKNEEELEEMVFEHYKDIFGEKSILFPKAGIKTVAGKKSIPDAFILSIDKKEWFIVEVELSKHPLYKHIIPQITKFWGAVKDMKTRKRLIDAFFEQSKKDPWKHALFKSEGIAEIHRFISQVVDLEPKIVIIIDEETKELVEVCEALPSTPTRIIFKTFCREGVGIAVHTHIFNRLLKPPPPPPPPPPPKIAVKDLLNAGYIKPGDRIHRIYKGKHFEAKVLSDGRIEMEDGTVCKSLSGAAKHVSGHSAEDGWHIWKYRDRSGKIVSMDEMRKSLKKKRKEGK